jgi:hypothetical protein
MKTSSKRRKLEYIREKNYYRKGGKCSSFLKVSKEMTENTNFIKGLIRSEEFEIAKKLKNRFKMKFALTNIETGLNGDDFIMDLTTFKFNLKVVM